MRFTVTMKDPDRLDDAIAEAVRVEVYDVEELATDEKDAIVAMRCEKVGELASRWFEYGEYLRVEIDADAMTATVLPVPQ